MATAPPTSTTHGALNRLTHSAARAARRRPKTIVAVWLFLVVICVGAGSVVGTKSLTSTQSEVGQSARADQIIDRAGLRSPAVEDVLVTSPDAARTAAAVGDATSKLGSLPGVTAVRGPSQTPVLSRDGGRVALIEVTLRGDPTKAADQVGPVLDAVASVQRSHPGTTLQESGSASQDKAINDLIGHDLQHAELFSLPVTLLVLLLAFGALVAASVPLLLGLTSVAAALGALGLVSQLAPSSSSTSAVVVLIGLAVGVDYSLFYVRREREERRRGRSSGAALEAAAASVGRAILVSGFIVMVALGGLLITGQGDFVSIGLGTMVVVFIAVIGSLTVLPAMLALLGDRVDRGRVPGYRRLVGRRTHREAAAGRRLGVWAGLARAVAGHPASALVTAACILGTLAVPMFGMRTANLGVADLPPHLPVVEAYQAIDRYFPGAPQTADLVVTGTDLTSPAARAGLLALGERALEVTGGLGQLSVEVSPQGTVATIAVPMPETGIAAAKATVQEIRATIAPLATTVPGVHKPALVTGDAASSLDYSNRMGTATPEIIGFVLALGFLLLLLTFRAPLLAAAVMALNALSVGAAYGILTAVFQHTWAEHLLAFRSTGHIIDWLPLFMFVVLFGLSMDYTVLILERIREARAAGLDPRRAATEGVAATAGTVTSAAIVMVAVFSVFGTLQVINFKQIGIGLAAAVLLDATIVRGVALPALVTLLGERGWPVRRCQPPRALAVDHRDPGWDDAAVTPDGFGGRAWQTR